MKKSKKSNRIIWGTCFLATFGLIFLGLYLQSIERTDTDAETDLVIPQTTTIVTYGDQLNLQKPGKFVSSQDITVSSQANGKVGTISVKEGDSVKGGQTVIKLSDTIANYDLQVERTQNALERAKLTRKQTELNLDQQIEAAKNAYESAQQAYEHAKKLGDITIKQADLQLTDTDLTISNSINQVYENAVLDLKNTINDINSRLDSYDKKLIITDKYKHEVSRNYNIGADNLTAKNQSEKLYREISDNLDILRGLYDNLALKKTEDLTEEEVMEAYGMVRTIGNQLIDRGSISYDMFKASVTSSSYTLAQIELDASEALKNQAQGIQYVQKYTNVSDIIVNGSRDLNQEKADLANESTKANAENSVFNAEMALKNAKLNLDTLTENRDVQLGLMDNAITDAEIAYETARTQYNKLLITSPISGIIGDIFVSEGQEVGMGTPMFKISGIQKQQIEVYITYDEYQYVQEDKPVEVEYQNKMLTGYIDSINTVADSKNLYKVIIQLNSDVSLLGDIAKVSFPIKTSENTLLPIGLVKILSDNLGEVAIWSGNSKENYQIEIKHVWGEYVELEEPIPADLELIE